MSKALLHPLEVLYDIQQKCLQQAGPEMNQATRQDYLLSFFVPPHKLLMSNEGIVEILRIDSKTRISHIPTNKPWHRGLMSVQGQLVNIIDLQSYLMEKTTEIDNKTRIIIVRRGVFMSGLLVPEIGGLIPQQNVEKTARAMSVPGSSRVLSTDICNIAGKPAILLNMEQLFADPQFTQASAN